MDIGVIVLGADSRFALFFVKVSNHSNKGGDMVQKKGEHILNRSSTRELANEIDGAKVRLQERGFEL